MARPKKEGQTKITARVSKSARQVIWDDAIDKGYKVGDGAAFGQYFEAIAAEILAGRLKIPKKLLQ